MQVLFGWFLESHTEPSWVWKLGGTPYLCLTHTPLKSWLLFLILSVGLILKTVFHWLMNYGIFCSYFQKTWKEILTCYFIMQQDNETTHTTNTKEFSEISNHLESFTLLNLTKNQLSIFLSHFLHNFLHPIISSRPWLLFLPTIWVNYRQHSSSMDYLCPWSPKPRKVSYPVPWLSDMLLNNWREELRTVESEKERRWKSQHRSRLLPHSPVEILI